jgi:hypothetical protein
MINNVSTLRQWLLRACYLLLVVGLALKFWPVVFGDIATLPRMDGVVVALLSTMGLVSIAGLFFPMRMLPILVFEVAWKAIWAVTVALPNWQNGTVDEGMSATIFACTWAIPLVVVIPWRYVVASMFRPTLQS